MLSVARGAGLSPCAFLFDRVGVILIKSDKSFDSLFELIIDTDAEDLELVDKATYAVRTSQDKLWNIVVALKEHGLEIVRLLMRTSKTEPEANQFKVEAELQYCAKDSETTDKSTELVAQVRDLVVNLESDPDVMRVWTSAKIS